MLFKENIDWENLGNFSLKSKYLFCKTSKLKFDNIFDKAKKIVEKSNWSSVHEDVFIKNQRLIRKIALRTRIRIAKGDRYGSNEQIPYNPFSIFTFYKVLRLTLRYILPLKWREKIKDSIRKML
jgi:hypothetical protein